MPLSFLTHLVVWLAKYAIISSVLLNLGGTDGL